MIIKKIHMDHFGKFQDYSLELGSGFNLVFGNNEEGKSTIMAFIQMMFYGYSGRSRDLSKHLRNKYRPWNGNEMKGHIIFQAKEEEYRLERTFGQSNSTDLVNLWNETTGQAIRLNSQKDVGVHFLGLGEEAFARSVFIRQGATNIQGSSRSDEITNRLSNLVTTGSEEVSYQAAADRLEEAMSLLVSKNKKKGLVVKKEQELGLLLEARQQALEDEGVKLKVQAELETMVQEKQERYSKKQALLEKIQAYEELKEREEIKKALKRLDHLNELTQEFHSKKDRLKGNETVVDESFHELAKAFIKEWTSLTEYEQELDQKIKSLQLELSELEKKRPLEIQAENFLKAREGVDRLRRIRAAIQEQEEGIRGLEKYLKQADKTKSLEEKLEEAEFAQREALVALTDLQHTIQELEGIIKEAQSLEEEEKNLQIETHIKLRSLAAEIKDGERRLARDRQELGRKIVEKNQEVNQKPDQDHSGGNRRGKQGKILLIAFVIGLASLILGWTVNSFYYFGLLLSFLLLYPAFKTKDLRRSSEDHTVTRQTTAEQAEDFAAQALKAMDDQGRELKTRQEDLQDLQKTASEIETAYYRRREEVKGLKARWEQEQKLLNQAKMEEQRAAERCQDLELRLKHERADLLNNEIQGTRFDLVEQKVALSEQEAEVDQLNRYMESLLKKTNSKNFNDFTDLYYDGVAFQEKLEKAQDELVQLKQKRQEAQAREENQRQNLLDHMALYQRVSTPNEAALMVQDLERDLSEFNRLSIQLDSAQAHRVGLELDYSKEELVDQLKVLNDRIAAREGLADGIDESVLKQYKDEAASLGLKISELDRTIAAKSAQAKEKYRHQPNVSQLDESLEALDLELKKYKQEYEALKLAKEVLTEAFAEMQRSFGPLVNESTAKIFNRLTKGKYSQVRVNRDFDIAVEEQNYNSLREWGYLSGGTVDQAYLSLRLAIADLITKDQEPLPLFLDDVFTQYDDDRARQGFEFLQEYATEKERPNQVVLFTCHNRLRSWVDPQINQQSQRVLQI